MKNQHIHRYQPKLLPLILGLINILVTGCNSGNSNNAGSTSNSGDATRLTFTAPNIILSVPGKGNSGFVEVNNPTTSLINGIKYNLGNVVGSGVNAEVESTAAANCSLITAGGHCTLKITIPSGSVSGSFSLSASNTNTSSLINNLKLGNSTVVAGGLPANPVIGIGQVLYNSINGADGVALYYYHTVIAGLPFIVVTGAVLSDQAGSFNNVVLVDGNNSPISGQQVISGNLGAGLPNLEQGDTFNIVMPVPVGANATQIIKIKTEQVPASGDVTNSKISTTATTLNTVTGVGIINMIPSSIYLTSSAPSQQITFTNSGDSGALLENLVSSNPNIRVIFTPGPLSDNSSKVDKLASLKAVASSTATLELINPDLPASSGDLTLTYNNGEKTVTETVVVDQNVIPSPTPAPSPTPVPTPTPSPTPTPVPVPNIIITPVPNPLGNIMMGSGFQFTATISVIGSSTVSASFVNPASGVITSNPSSCALDVSGTTSCTFTAITAWDTELVNSSGTNYQIVITATNNATISDNLLSYTENTPAIYLPQTGQTPTSPYPEPSNSDGDIHAGIPWAYVASGSTTPAQRFTDDGCEVTDHLTGLIWVKDLNTVNSGNPFTWYAALDAAAAGTWCGQPVGSWRMPNVNELYSLINYAQVDNATWLNNQNFEHVSIYQYWTSTTTAGTNVYALTVPFPSASSGAYAQDKPNPVGRLFPVRGTTTAPAAVAQTGQTPTLPYTAQSGSDGALQMGIPYPSPRFSVESSDAQCITDNLTGLTWVRDPSTINNGNSLAWSSALDIADNGSWCGYSDWRVPNINEFRSLVNYAYNSQINWLMYGSGSSEVPACDGACFSNLTQVLVNYFWSSTTYPNNADSALCLGLDGGSYSDFPKPGDEGGYTCGVWPVRGGN